MKVKELFPLLSSYIPSEFAAAYVSGDFTLNEGLLLTATPGKLSLEVVADCLSDSITGSTKLDVNASVLPLISLSDRKKTLWWYMLVRRLRSLALHPSAYQRLSAASVFNHLYRDFREESSLVSLYAL